MVKKNNISSREPSNRTVSKKFDNNEGFISLPKIKVIDFPARIIRGISMKMDSRTLTVENVTKLIPFLAKYKFNYVSVLNSEKIQYSPEQHKKLIDLCKFHHMSYKISENPEILLKENATVKNVENFSESSFPDYKNTLIALSEEISIEGIILSNSYEKIWSRGLLKIGIPLVSEMMWNFESLSANFWRYMAQATQLNLFESKINMDENHFESILDYAANTDNIDSIKKRINAIRKTAFENVQLLDLLEHAYSQPQNL
jgi:hypothetical protein